MRVLKCLYFFLFLFFSFSFYTKGQGKLVTFYEGSTRPCVISILKTLKNDIDTINKVTYLNELTALSTEEQRIRNLLEKLSREKVKVNSDKRDAFQEKLTSSLLEFNFYLKIEYHEIFNQNGMLHFFLYKAEAGQKTDTASYFPTILKDEEMIEKVVFTVEDNEQTRERKIHNALKRLFWRDNNQPPILKMKINDLDYSPPNIYYHVYNTPLILDASYSNDQVIQRKYLSYKWKQINPKGGNAPKEKEVVLNQTAQNIVSLPDTGTYYFSINISNEISSSQTETIIIKGIERPKIKLSSTEYRIRSRASIFQWFIHKHFLTKVNYTLEGTFEGESQLNYQPSLNLVDKKELFCRRKTNVQKIKQTNNGFAYKFEGRLFGRNFYKYNITGTANNIQTDTVEFYLRKPEKDFLRLTLGFPFFIGGEYMGILGRYRDRVWVAAPLEAKGGIYLVHWDNPNSSIVFEGGVLLFFMEKNKNTITEGLGIMSLKWMSESFRIKKSLIFSAYISFNLIGGLMYNNLEILENQRHWGFSLGYKINNVEIDLLNIYYNFKYKELSLAGGIRLDFFPMFSDGFSFRKKKI